MTDEQKIRQIEKLPREAEELDAEEAEKAEGGDAATGGAGAGKIKFNEFTIKKTSDQASPSL
jgi:hypothetical protein